jgi:DNA-binding NarL/FixJ family response regulator
MNDPTPSRARGPTPDPAQSLVVPVRKLRIVLADDHIMLRQGIKSLICAQPDLEVVGEAANGEEALRKVKELQPDLLVMDISMPELNGIQVMERLKQTGSTTRVIGLTAFGETAYLRHLLAAGASGYVLKQAAFEELIAAVRAVAAGGTRKVVSGFVEHKKLRGSREGDELSEREREVLRCVARGYTNKEIASQLNISVKTVETHKANFMEKLGLHTRAEIVRFALHRGWLED